MATGATPIPAILEDYTASWFSEVLGAEVSQVEVIDSHSGTTGRAKFRLTSNGDVPETMFAKLPAFDPDQRAMMAMSGIPFSEAVLYETVGNELPVRAPRCYYAASDEESGLFVILLEDLVASGCRFLSAEAPDVLDVAQSVMDELPKLHAKYWGQELPFLAMHALSAHPPAKFDMIIESVGPMIQTGIDMFADDLPPEFRQFSELFVARWRDLYELYTEGERTMVHGDDHIGNLVWDTRADHVGFYDWSQSAKFPGPRDVAYFMCNSLPTEVRRSEDRALLARYRSGLSAHGVETDEKVIFDQFRLFTTWSWVAAVTTAIAGSTMQPIEVTRRATERTTQALIDYDVMGLLREKLGPL